MSVALAGRSPSSFEIKSASLPLLALRLKLADLDVLATELDAQYGAKPGFFEDDLLVVDLSALQPGTESRSEGEEADAAVDFNRLLALLQTHRLKPVAARGGSAAQMAAALAAGLTPAPDVRVQQRSADSEAPRAAVTQPVAAEAPPPGALIIDRPLRSGQQIYARGRDLVLLAMVNPGSEVIADGHIHVYAPLRGRAVAGARGWGDARIFAHEMRPELVSIAGVYRTSDEPLPETVWGRGATVRLHSDDAGDKLIFEPVPS